MKETRFEDVEELLREVSPEPLSARYLDQLDDLMVRVKETEEFTEVSEFQSELTSLEKSLAAIMPQGMSGEMIERLDQAMSRWHETVPVEEKVVAMPMIKNGTRSTWIGLRSVASVACFGALFALGWEKIGSGPTLAEERIPVSVKNQLQPVNFRPGVVDTCVVKRKERGLIWTRKGDPVRCQEVVVRNRLLFVNEKGERLIIERPQREVHFSKVKFD